MGLNSVREKWVKLASNYKLLTIFAARGVLAVVAWAIFYTFLRHTPFIDTIYENITTWLTNSFLYVSGGVLKLLQYEITIIDKVIKIGNSAGVLLDRGCLGRNLMGLFAGFILIFPARGWSKLWFIPAGLIIIYILNVIRICALALTMLYSPDSIDFNHHVLFQYVVYGVIFLMWVWWIKRYSSIKNVNRNTD